MTDPRLNSVHLEAPPRRQEYRRARQDLLQACGLHTLAPEEVDRPEDRHTQIDKAQAKQPTTFPFVLMDRDFIFPLKTGINTVGRMPDNDVVLENPGISRRHCAIVIHGGQRCEVHDTASKNGTYLNGRRLTGPTKLRSGDEIRICERQLVFVRQSEGSADLPPGAGGRTSQAG
jgi:hypothetical protein